MKTSLFTVATLLLIPVCVGAQTIYRCGNTFSKTPCGVGASEFAVVQDDAPKVAPVKVDPIKVDAMKAECLSMIRNRPQWKDRDSLKISNPLRMPSETRQVDGASVSVIPYHAFVNAKNSYGAYAGDRSAFCYANETETKIVSFRFLN